MKPITESDRSAIVSAVFADKAGRIYDHPHLEMAGRSGNQIVRAKTEDLIPLPEGSRLFSLPEREALGWDPSQKDFSTTRGATWGDRRRRGIAVSAFLPPGYTRILLPATTDAGRRPVLPLWSYTAVGWRGEEFLSAAIRTDPIDHSESVHFDDRELVKRVKARLRVSHHNRLFHQLARCATEYHCFAAKNLFLGRWEAPLPTSPTCNSSCLGCLSLQPADCCPASQERIRFIPTVSEVVEVAVSHLQATPKGIISFGQGCEGEPLMQGDLLERSIREIRGRTDRGTIHLNTNGSDPPAIDQLCRAGLDSIRISLNSADHSLYCAYFRPRGYGIKEVTESIRRAKGNGIFTSINLLVFPGVTDREAEVEGLVQLVEETQLDMIQMRNLSIDPDLYLSILPDRGDRCIGIRNLLRLLKKEFLSLEIGYFNRSKELFGIRLCEQLTF